ncbi:MAG: hypothetical protein JWO49_1979 [Arthrobacter sp.]|nr:hypothetical protein [Arthrobacter sp.]
MKCTLAALSAASIMLMLTGCGQVQEAAQGAASDAASKVAGTAADQIKNQVCALVDDGLVNLKDKELLGGLVAGAEAAGVPSEITTPLKQIAASGDQVPAESVKALKDACTA